MKKLALITALALAAPLARATSITGNVAIAGADTYTTSGIHFNGPAVVLIGTGNFLPLVGMVFPINPPSNQLNYSSAAGVVLFSAGGISMDMLTLTVVSESSQFLNIAGTANMVQSGFDTTLYDYTMTATRPDGVSSFTLTAVPPVSVTPIPEPAMLLLLGTGLLALGLLSKVRRGANHNS